ncbi:MAG: hypothetical protein HY606_01360, partial [Planctomycetes bacterium]|nr:hypothetical protein [Planctomycetota bacterium]
MARRDTTIGGEAWDFPSTIWSIVLNAKNKTTAEYQKSLNKLVSMYWKPVYRYIRIAWDRSNEDSKDLT